MTFGHEVTINSVPPPMSSAPTLTRPGILKPPSVLLGTDFSGGVVGPQAAVPDVASSSGGSSSVSSTLASGGNHAGGVCAVPNCSANCGRPQSILKQQTHAMSNGSDQTGGAEPTASAPGVGFNSSCQQCIAERAAGVNTVSK